MALFYDNDISSLPVSGTSYPVERVYCLRLSAFESEHWEQLQRVYEALPGWVGVGEHGCSCWYGKSEQPPFLLASVEPSGLVVTGALPEQEWHEWHKAIQPALAKLPHFEV